MLQTESMKGIIYPMKEKAVFDDFANKYDKWFETPEGRKVKELELALLMEFVNPFPGAKMLEVGIGTGLFALEFAKAGAEVFGVEPSDKMREIAEKRGFTVKKGTGENIPFEDNSFDIVLAMTSLEFSKEPQRFVSEMKRVAKCGGTVVVAVLNLLSLYGIERRMRGLFEETIFKSAHFYTYWELKKLLAKNFGRVEISSSVFFPPNPSERILKYADRLEVFGRKYLKPFGALLVGKGVKDVC